jgi:hypothetical protein
MQRLVLVSCVLLSSASAVVDAEEIDYSWIEADYVHVSPDDADSVDGARVRSSGAVGEHFNVIAGWSHTDDSRAWYAGFGYHAPVSEGVDLYAELAFEKDTAFDEHAYIGRIGVHAELAPAFEASAAVAYSKSQHGESGSEFAVEALYKLNPTWGLVAEASIGEDEKSCVVGVRMSFR